MGLTDLNILPFLTLLSPWGLIIVREERLIWRHSYEDCLNTLLHDLPPQVWMISNLSKARGPVLLNMTWRKAAQRVHVPWSCSDIHAFGPFTSLLAVHINIHLNPAVFWTHRCTLTHDKSHMPFVGSTLSYLLFKASQLFKCMMQDWPPHYLARQKSNLWIN